VTVAVKVVICVRARNTEVKVDTKVAVVAVIHLTGYLDEQ
jgi:hypothetical protein